MSLRKQYIDGSNIIITFFLSLDFLFYSYLVRLPFIKDRSFVSYYGALVLF